MYVYNYFKISKILLEVHDLIIKNIRKYYLKLCNFAPIYTFFTNIKNKISKGAVIKSIFKSRLIPYPLPTDQFLVDMVLGNVP